MDRTVDGLAINIDGNASGALIATGVTVGSTTTTAVSSVHGRIDVQVNGTITGAGPRLKLGDALTDSAMGVISAAARRCTPSTPSAR